MPATVALREAISSFCSKLSCREKAQSSISFYSLKKLKDKPVQSYNIQMHKNIKIFSPCSSWAILSS